MADYYTNSSDPSTGSALISSVPRAENAAIAAGFVKVAPYTGHANEVVYINASATAQASEPAFAYNATTNVLTVNGSTFGTNTSIGGTLSVTGTLSTTSPAFTTSITTPSTTFALVNTTATTVNFAGAATTLNIGAATGTLTVANTTLSAKAGTFSAVITSTVGLGNSFLGSSGASDATVMAIIKGQPGAAATGGYIGQNWNSNSGASGMERVNTSYNASAFRFDTATTNYGGLVYQQINQAAATVVNTIVVDGTSTPIANTLYLKAGNVGIGTATGASELSINGGLHVGGDSDAGDNNAIIDGTLNVVGVATLGNGAVLGTPASITLTNATGTAASLTAGTASAVAVGGITGLGTGVGTFLATPSSANLASAVTDEVGSDLLMFGKNITTFTPELAFGGASVGITYAAQNGRYAVSGKLGIATAELVLTSKGSSTGNATISGFPQANAVLSSIVQFVSPGTTFTGQTYAGISASGTSIALNQIIEAGTASALTDANFANGSTIYVSAIYILA